MGSRVFARFSGDGTYLGSHMRGYHVIDDMTVSPDGAIAVSSFKDVDVTPPLDILASGRAR